MVQLHSVSSTDETSRHLTHYFTLTSGEALSEQAFEPLWFGGLSALVFEDQDSGVCVGLRAPVQVTSTVQNKTA